MRPDHRLYLVADGVGGRNCGEVASKLACLSAVNFFEEHPPGAALGRWERPEDVKLAAAARRLLAAVRYANHAVVESASERPEYADMNTTLVALHADPQFEILHVAHVGDSRCYGVRGEKMVCLTVDHSVRNEALRQYPDIDREKLEELPENMLSRAIGRRATVEVDLRSVSARRGDRFLACSDGLTKMLSDFRIARTIYEAPSSQDACHRLVDLANEAGGRDNVTAAVLSF